jgi:hypothetical protein
MAVVKRNVHQRSTRSSRIKAATAAPSNGLKIRTLSKGKPSLAPGRVMTKSL